LLLKFHALTFSKYHDALLGNNDTPFLIVTVH
jgi:hypothetical protein